MSIIKEKNVRKSFPERLLMATKTWQSMLKPSLANRELMLRARASGYYGTASNDSRDKSHPINLIDRGLNIIVPYLVMNDPRILVSTKKKEYRPFALTTELAFNHLIREIKFAKNSLRPAILDSMVGMGILKTGIMKSHELEIFGHLHSVGQVYSDPVDLVDYIGDPTARSFENFEFEGNFYRMPIAAAKELFPKHADNLTASYSLFNGDRQHDPEKMAKNMSVDGMFSSLREFVQLADYWIPDENIIVTIDPRSKKILRTVDAETPEGGPYDKLYYKSFPGTPAPIPPVWYWLDMDQSLNVIVNKMRRQAEAQKTNLAYSGDAADDAEALANAPDLKSVRVSDTQSVKAIEWPGIDPQHYNWIQYLEQQYSMQGSNLYTLGGANSQAGTLGQEQMLMANASKSIDDMSNSVYEFTKSVAKKMLFHFWSDPLISVPQIKRIEGFGDLPVVFDKAAQDGEFWDYEFDVEPYSMQRLSPGIEYQRTMGLLSQWILPTAQIAAQQGAQLNVPEATKHLAKMAGLRGFDKMYETAIPDTPAKLNPYTPTQGKPKNRDIADGRTGVAPQSAEANSRQKLQRDGNQL